MIPFQPLLPGIDNQRIIPDYPGHSGVHLKKIHGVLIGKGMNLRNQGDWKKQEPGRYGQQFFQGLFVLSQNGYRAPQRRFIRIFPVDPDQIKIGACGQLFTLIHVGSIPRVV